MLNIGYVKAETHTPEYLLHKYWARKPHNVVAHFIRELLPNGGTVLDPFCGSGVSLREASLLGCDALGIDVNPVACLISKVLVNPPPVDEFKRIVYPILERVQAETESAYMTKKGQVIKYLIHSIIVKCSCGLMLAKDEAECQKKSAICPQCKKKLFFNLENLSTTRLRGYVCDKQVEIDESEIEAQSVLSDSSLFLDDITPYNFSVDTNKRILAFRGMMTENFFTKRNFSVLVHLAELFNKIDDSIIKDAALLLLTASAAQCSRLIPTRNNLSTGGPAWSVPGFWVPNEHLETNPINHLMARYKKFVKGLQTLAKKKSIQKVDVINRDSISYLECTEEKFDLVFLDPPYGDSVPYTEFSIIWNSLLRSKPDSNSDISVSDRGNKIESWSNYYSQIEKLFLHLSRVLNADGKIVITFNNNDLRAWKALMGGLQNSGFSCRYAVYQIPAVVSSKAQFAQDSSYISDIYSVFDLSLTPVSRNLSLITEQLIAAARIRGGTITLSLAKRVALVNWLRQNISADLLSEIDNMISSLFIEGSKKGELVLRNNDSNDDSGVTLKMKCIEAAEELLKKGPRTFEDIIEKVCVDLYELGMPDPQEVKDYLSCLPKNKTSYLSGLSHSERQGSRQLSFFESEKVQLSHL